MTFRLSDDHPIQFHRVWGRKPRFGRCKWIEEHQGAACDIFTSESEARQAKEDSLTPDGKVRYLVDAKYRQYIDAKFARSSIFM